MCEKMTCCLYLYLGSEPWRGPRFCSVKGGGRGTEPVTSYFEIARQRIRLAQKGNSSPPTASETRSCSQSKYTADDCSPRQFAPHPQPASLPTANSIPSSVISELPKSGAKARIKGRFQFHPAIFEICSKAADWISRINPAGHLLRRQTIAHNFAHGQSFRQAQMRLSVALLDQLQVVD